MKKILQALTIILLLTVTFGFMLALLRWGMSL